MVMRIHGPMVDFRQFDRYDAEMFVWFFIVDRLWRKTRSPTSNPNCFGADPNRNWDYEWCEGKRLTLSPIYFFTELSRWCYTRSLRRYLLW